MGFKLPDLHERVRKDAAALPDCPNDFVTAVTDFLTKLYGDDPARFDGPDEIEMGDNWFGAYFQDYDAGITRGTLRLVYCADGTLAADCELQVVQVFEGEELTLRALRENFMK